MRIVDFLHHAGTRLVLCTLLALGFGNALAETATISDECGTLTMTSRPTTQDGDYMVDLEGVIPSSYYHMAYVYLDGSPDYALTFSSFWSNSLATSIGPYTGSHLFKLVMRGGGSHGICETSLELAVGNLEKDPIAMSNDLCSAIRELDDGAFKNQPDQRKNALCNKLVQVATQIEYATNAGDPGISNLYYMNAIAKLSNDIGAKMDALFGGHKNNDWIVAPEAQATLHPMVHEIIETLQAKM
jgi:hypothetical protein